ncbi:DUF6063 family protein [Bacillus pacificus]
MLQAIFEQKIIDGCISKKTLKFLEKEKLIRIREQTNVSVTNKMKNIISHYYHNVENKSKIHDLLLVTKEGTVGEEEE